MEQSNFMNCLAETAKRYVNHYWQSNLAAQLIPKPEKDFFIDGSGSGFAAARSLTFLRHPQPKTFGCLILADPQGDDPEIEKAIQGAKAQGQHTLLITGERCDAAASKADHCIFLKTCQGYFGAADYLAAQILLLAICCSHQVQMGKISPERFHAIGQEICSYAESLSKKEALMLSCADAFARQIARNWQLDLIADGSIESVSEYLRALYGKEGGFLASVNDSEEWCHVDFWCLERTDIAAICACPKGSPAFSRFVETMSTVHRLERPYLIVTDAEEEEFYPGTRICQMPPLTDENWFLASLFFHIPAVIALDTVKNLRLEQEVPHE